MLHKHILLSPNGFEISSHSQKYLAEIGSRVFLRYTGYINQVNIRNCISNNPGEIQNCVEACALFYAQALLNSECLRNENFEIEIYISQSISPQTTEYSLFLITNQEKMLPFLRSVLCKTLDVYQ